MKNSLSFEEVLIHMELKAVCPMFHISMLKKFVGAPSLIVPLKILG